MPALNTFTDWLNYTPSVFLTDPDQFMNDAIVQMPMIGRLLIGRDPREVLQGGATIRDPLKLSVQTTLRRFSPADPYGGYALRQSSTLGEIRWRFIRDHMAFTEAEIMLNQPGGNPMRLWKRVRTSKEQDLFTSKFNGMEDLWLADPSVVSGAGEADIEGAAGTHPYPLYALVNEETNRLPQGWTGNRVQGIDRTIQTNYQNVLNQYDFNQPDDQDADNDGLLDAFEETWLELQWEPPQVPGVPTERYFQRSGRDPRRMFIAASTQGVRFYKRRLLERNDTLAGRSDPAYDNPKYGGIPVVQASNLGTATLYEPASGAANARVAETGAAADVGHRYYWLDGNYLVPIFHVEKFFQRMPAMILPDQPDTTVQICQTWYNFFLRSAKRQAIVSPGA